MIFLEPEFYDLFGILVFIFLIFVSLRGLKKKEIKKWIFKIILIIGFFGLIVDSLMVFMRFVK